MKVSVITWDASFREHLHTIDFFGRQNYEPSEYELIWVDYYASRDEVHSKINQYANARILALENPLDQKWHLGDCINAGVAASSGELLIIPDGDIAVEPDFIEFVSEAHQKFQDLVIYFRRYDEPAQMSSQDSRHSLTYLKNVARLTNPTNYGGCLTLRRTSFERINGYETHPAFAGPGCQGIETYTRLSNAGMAIQWAPDKKIFHPWHPLSGDNLKDSQINAALASARAVHPWIIPYAGLEQSWITHNRSKHIQYRASSTQCDQYLSQMPSIDMAQWLPED